MDSKQKGIVILAVVVVVIAAVFAAQALDDKHNESDAAEVNFLIQDNQGFYFWVNGEGETVYDAWKDAVKSFDLPFVASVDKEGNEYGIKSLFGLSTAQDATGGWTWWTQYFYNGSAWESNSLYMINMAAKDYSSIAMVYGDGKVAPAVAPSDAKVWNKDTTGTLFTIQSPSVCTSGSTEPVPRPSMLGSMRWSSTMFRTSLPRPLTERVSPRCSDSP